jgi:hypothetical protein
MRNNVILPEQPMENIMMAVDWTTYDKLLNQPAATECDQSKFLSLIKVYIDDFIGVIQSTNKAHLLQFSRRILDGITKVFPPPILSGSKMAHPVSEKKLFEDGIWDTRKKILGWLAIPCGKPILGQLNWYMSFASKHPGKKLVVTDALQAILRDWLALI